MITVCGKGSTLAQIERIKPTTPPRAGSRWKPVKHIDFIRAIKADVKMRGWEVADEKYAVAAEGADMAGAIAFHAVGTIENIPGMNFALGFLNSNSRRKAMRLTVGVSIACCLNGMCTGTLLLSQLHDHTVDLAAQIKAAMDNYEENARGIPAMIKSLRDRVLTDAEASYVIMQAGCLHQFIGWATVGRIWREYTDPTFTEHGEKTSWALLNAFTYAARPNLLPTRQMEAYNTFRKLLPVAAPAAEDTIEEARRKV